MTVKPVDIEKLKNTADNIYEAIVVMSKRARQINEEVKIEFNQRVEMVQTKIFDPEEETDIPQTNPDQILIAKEFEQRANPPEIAINEMMGIQLTFRYKEDEILPVLP
ncbi:MAG: DNA-directed RNA polymerase subunit omega [Bacteroidota bacterium]